MQQREVYNDISPDVLVQLNTSLTSQKVISHKLYTGLTSVANALSIICTYKRFQDSKIVIVYYIMIGNCLGLGAHEQRETDTHERHKIPLNNTNNPSN